MFKCKNGFPRFVIWFLKLLNGFRNMLNGIRFRNFVYGVRIVLKSVFLMCVWFLKYEYVAWFSHDVCMDCDSLIWIGQCVV